MSIANVVELKYANGSMDTATDDAYHVWGIDPAVKGLAITRLNGDRCDIAWIKPDPKVRDEWKRMRQLQADFKKDCVAYIKEHGKPRAVFVEAPVIYDKPSVLAMAQMFALVRIVLEEQRVPVFGTPVSTWKAKSSFKGGASKDHVAQLVQIRLPTLAQAVVDLKVPKVNWEDCFDSAGIALYGRGVLRKAAA